MEIIEEIVDKKQWDDFLEKNAFENYPYFQSWSWGQIQKKLGVTLYRIGLFDTAKQELIGVCSFSLIRAKRGTYFHLRHGPVLQEFSKKNLDFVLEYIKKLGHSKNVAFLRLSPLLSQTLEHEKLFQEPYFLSAPIHRMDGEVCWVLQLEKSEEELLMDMRKTHRYLIRKAPTMDIEIIRGKNMSDIDDFLHIYKKLAMRKHFIPHKGVREEFEEFSKTDNCLLLLTKHDQKIIAGAMVVFTPTMAIYRHGASLEEYKDIPASYLLQWEAIKEAKKRGMKLYNFWGIAPIGEKKHPWAGLTLFKTGFGGEIREYIHAHDMPISFWYWKTYMIELISKYKKGY